MILTNTINMSKFLTPQVAAGGTHSVVLTREGHVWTWGQPWPPGDMYVHHALKSTIVFLFLCCLILLLKHARIRDQLVLIAVA